MSTIISHAHHETTVMPCAEPNRLPSLRSTRAVEAVGELGSLTRPLDRRTTMKTTNLIFALVAVLVLSGCATGYQSNGFTGGYSDTQLAPDVYRIVFRGNGYTAPERAQDFALLRASELTLQRGFACFAIIDERNSTSTSSFTTPGHADTTAYGSGYSSGNIYLNPYGGSYSGTSSAYVNAHTTYTPPQTYVFYKPQTGIMVRAFQTKPDGIFTFDAAFLQESLKQKYRFK